jgi:hypothetical protein
VVVKYEVLLAIVELYGSYAGKEVGTEDGLELVVSPGGMRNEEDVLVKGSGDVDSGYHLTVEGGLGPFVYGTDSAFFGEKGFLY